MPGYFVLAASLSSAFLLHPRGLPVGPAKTLEAENKLGIPGVMAEAGGPPGGGIAADISDDDGLAHGGMPGGMAGGIPGDMAGGMFGGMATGGMSGGMARGGMPGGMATGGMPGGMATGGMPGGIAAGTSDDTPGIAGGVIIAAVQGAKHC